MKSGRIDLLLVVGASLNQITTLSWDPRLAPTKCLIHVNIDPTEIGKNYHADIPLVGDATTIISEISFRVLRHFAAEGDRWKRREESLQELRREVGMCVDPEKMLSEAVPLKPQRIIHELQQALPEDAILFVDVGNSMGWATHYLTCRKPGSLIMPFGLLAMGFGIAGAVGGKLAAGDRPVVCLAGDGCFLMNGMEVAASVSEDIPVVFVILNNAKLGLVHDLQTFALGEKTVATRFKRIDAAKVAEGLGAVGCRVERPGELQQLLPEAIRSGKTVVIDCMIDPSEMAALAPFVDGAREFSKTPGFRLETNCDTLLESFIALLEPAIDEKRGDRSSSLVRAGARSAFQRSKWVPRRRVEAASRVRKEPTYSAGKRYEAVEKGLKFPQSRGEYTEV